MRKFVWACALALWSSLQASTLPESIIFVGPTKYQALVSRGLAENWRAASGRGAHDQSWARLVRDTIQELHAGAR